MTLVTIFTIVTLSMIKRFYFKSDPKTKDDRWQFHYSNINLDEYKKTLEYEGTTAPLNDFFSQQDKKSKILDVGCGPGRYLHHLNSMGFLDLTGLDASNEAINLLKKLVPQAKPVCADATSMPFEDSTFDIVLMVGVFYEIEAPEMHAKLFKEIYRILKPQGKFILINNSPYHLGERLYSFTQKLELNYLRGEEKTFFCWRVSHGNIKRILSDFSFGLLSSHPANVAQGLFRFLYGILVKTPVGRANSDDTAAYRLHPYYLVEKQPELLNFVGRTLLRFAKKCAPFLFANSVLYITEKK